MILPILVGLFLLSGVPELAESRTSAPSFSVGMLDKTMERGEVANSFAAVYSRDSLIVLYRGANRTFRDEVRAGASDAKDAGIKVRGMVWGPRDDTYGRDYFVVYVDGQVVTRKIAAGNDARGLAKQAVTQAWEAYGGWAGK